MSKYYKYNTFFFYNINYLFKLSQNVPLFLKTKKINYIKKFKNSFRFLIYINVFLYKLNFFVYFFKKQIKNDCILNFNILNFSSFKTLKNLILN